MATDFDPRAPGRPFDPDDEHAPPFAACPGCGRIFPFAPANVAAARDRLVRSEEVPGWQAHVDGCKGSFHELSPDGKGFRAPIKEWSEPGYWTTPKRPVAPSPGPPAHPGTEPKG